jgi:hypothetical protein
VKRVGERERGRERRRRRWRRRRRKTKDYSQFGDKQVTKIQ